MITTTTAPYTLYVKKNLLLKGSNFPLKFARSPSQTFSKDHMYVLWGSVVQRCGDAFLIICPQDSSIGPSEKCEKGRHFKYVKTNEINFLFKLNINQSHDKLSLVSQMS